MFCCLQDHNYFIFFSQRRSSKLLAHPMLTPAKSQEPWKLSTSGLSTGWHSLRSGPQKTHWERRFVLRIRYMSNIKILLIALITVLRPVLTIDCYSCRSPRGSNSILTRHFHRTLGETSIFILTRNHSVFYSMSLQLNWLVLHLQQEERQGEDGLQKGIH